MSTRCVNNARATSVRAICALGCAAGSAGGIRCGRARRSLCPTRQMPLRTRMATETSGARASAGNSAAADREKKVTAHYGCCSSPSRGRLSLTAAILAVDRSEEQEMMLKRGRLGLGLGYVMQSTYD